MRAPTSTSGSSSAHRDERVVALELRVGARARPRRGRRRRARRSGARSPRRRSRSVNVAPPAARRSLQRHVVLDDPVDDDVDAVAAVEERVRVLLADAPVRRPARVADAGRRRPRGDAVAAVRARLACSSFARGGRGCRPRAPPRSCRRRSPRCRRCRSRGTRACSALRADDLLRGARTDVADDAAHIEDTSASATSSQLASTTRNEPRADGLGLLVGRRLDHHPHERLGAAGAHEHAPAAGELRSARARPPRARRARPRARRGRGRATLTSALRQLAIASRSLRSRPPSASSVSSARGDAVAGAVEAHAR